MEKMSSLANVASTRAVLDEFGLTTKYSLGQNFLVSDAIIQKIIGLASFSRDADVLEVGPGIGTLTMALLKNAKRVVSVERDSDLPAVLAETLRPWSDRFTLIEKDALDLQREDLPFEPTMLVANLPYAVAATVVLDYFEDFSTLESATIMVQKEVADRMVAQPGTKIYGAYTVKLRLYAEAAGRFAVGPGNFYPPPRVESSVLRLERRCLKDDAGMPLEASVLKAAATMADAAFATRRKTIANSCKTYFGGQGAQGAQIIDHLSPLFEKAGIDPRRRGETLDVSEFIKLGRAYLQIISE